MAPNFVDHAFEVIGYLIAMDHAQVSQNAECDKARQRPDPNDGEPRLRILVGRCQRDQPGHRCGHQCHEEFEPLLSYLLALQERPPKMIEIGN